MINDGQKYKIIPERARAVRDKNAENASERRKTGFTSVFQNSDPLSGDDCRRLKTAVLRGAPFLVSKNTNVH